LVDGLGLNGKLAIVGVAPEPLAITPLQLIMAGRSIQG
jgi:alcohol dehydrogenase